MEKISLLLIGALFGGGIVYFSKNDTVVNKTIFSKNIEQKECLDNSVVDVPLVKSKTNNDFIQKKTKIVEKKLKRTSSAYQNSNDERVLDIVTDVVSLEQQEAEREGEVMSETVLIDETIIPQELQEVENMIHSNDKIENVSDTIPTVNNEDVIIDNFKPAISEELSNLEEYGEDENLFEDENIPE